MKNWNSPTAEQQIGLLTALFVSLILFILSGNPHNILGNMEQCPVPNDFMEHNGQE